MPVGRAMLRLGAPFAAAVAVLAACSNTEAPPAKGPHNGTASASDDAGVQTVTLTTGNDYRFHPSTIVVHRGKVRVVLKNTATGGAPHNLQVTGLPGAFVPLATAGRTTMTTFTAPAPGRYKFVCTIHVRQGQTGTLIVKAGSP